MDYLAYLFLLLSVPNSVNQDKDDYWIDAMREVHGHFSGKRGTFAQFGDSITVTMAFWAPLPYARKNAPAEMEIGVRFRPNEN